MARATFSAAVCDGGLYTTISKRNEMTFLNEASSWSN